MNRKSMQLWVAGLSSASINPRHLDRVFTFRDKLEPDAALRREIDA